ncbi:nitrite reductase [Saccharococcus sp. Marseille-Q5394]|uniref:nitrite reductase n=1 Tax=Saccharococcus sp. Marseille-Q5394 TaxID=2972778 RepID=UPI0021C7C2D5|nr:nitrite reductase [Saccharococcus sp. Marseille-Q5394]
MKDSKIKIAVNGGINYGAKLTAKQLMVLAKHLGDEEELELTTFQQLYVEILEEKKEEIIAEFKEAGLHCYPVGNYVKSLRTCNFCKGSEEEGMPVAIELNNRIAGTPVPVTLRTAYTGCPVGCGEPLMNDIGVMKTRDTYSLYIGGKSKGNDASVGHLFKDKLSPEELYSVVEQLIDLYGRQGKKREQFHKFVKRVGNEALLGHIK